MPQIQIYARVRPSPLSFEGMRVFPENNRLGINIGEQDDITKRPESRYARAPPSRHSFQFSHVFDQKASQEEVFNHVAIHMIDSFLSGYNGTIFAYGQTASGKTHTIEGSSRLFSDRGLIPRTISTIFQEVERRCGLGQDVSVHVSYMEIYQDTGYDLLNPGTRPGALMVTLPKVQIMETSGSEVRVRNLSLHLAASENVAMSLLFQGSTCCKVAETSMNQCSSRSHTVFTIYLTVKSNAVITRSKLNLVDLAGSERVAKTKADGRVLREAKHINLSLHHLEHVIVTLQQLSSRHSSTPHHARGTGSRATRSPGNSAAKTPLSPTLSDHSSIALSPAVERELKGHIPYRNSMLTMVLKDSLGGNCLTAMIATISAEEGNIWETISTCRFSQRVACISNVPKCNEELDDKVVIKRLKQRIAELEAEVQQFKNGSRQEVMVSSSSQSDGQVDLSLSPSDQKLCHMILHQFFHGKIENPVQAGINSPGKFYECMHVMKKIVLHALDIENRKTGKETDHDKEVQREKKTTKNPQGSHEGRVREMDGAKRRRQQKGMSSSPGLAAVDSYDLETPLPAQLGNKHVVATHVGSKGSREMPNSHSKHNSVFQQESGHVAATSAPSLAGPKGSVSHPERSSLSSSLSRHSSGFGSMQDEGSSARLEWSEGKIHSSPAVVRAHDSEVNSRHREAQRKAPSRKMFEDDPRESLSTGDGHVSPVHAWVYPAPDLHESVTSPASREPSVQHTEKQVALRQSKLEKQKLARNVQLLNLRVLEGQLSNELSDMKEKVATQHARLVMAHRNGLDPEQLNSEKMIEQQLRIKQSKLKQKLASVTHEIVVAANNEMSPTSASPSIAEVSENLDLRQARAFKRPKKELDRQQIVVEDQIEKLRMMEMEKQLELKEAATKRKIQALRQQLVGASRGIEMGEVGLERSRERQDQGKKDGDVLKGINNAHAGDSPGHVTSHMIIPAFKHYANPSKARSKDYAALSKTQATTAALFSDHMTPPTSASFADHMTPPTDHMSLASLTSSPRPQHRTPPSTCTISTTSLLSPSNTSAAPSNDMSHVTPPNSHMTYNGQLTATLSPSSNVMFRLSPNANSISSPQSNDLMTTPNRNMVSNGHMTPPPNSSGHMTSPSDHMTSPSRHMTSSTSTPTGREKLTLPEEVKETIYMSAVQKQRVRVSRIRRCIVAATVIQRAWRDRQASKEKKEN